MLSLHRNDQTSPFQRTIPSQFSKLSQLSELYLEDFGLIGSIPDQLESLTSLAYLNLAQNELTGSIPTLFSNMVNLTTFIISSNKLCGCVPPFSQQLTECDIRGNSYPCNCSTNNIDCKKDLCNTAVSCNPIVPPAPGPPPPSPPSMIVIVFAIFAFIVAILIAVCFYYQNSKSGYSTVDSDLPLDIKNDKNSYTDLK